jgi:FkbM family methyltransferase
MSMLKQVVRKIFPSKQAKRVKPWKQINGDKTLRLNYDLDNFSVVFDLGGYEGQWASDIFSKYQCTVFVFEPYLPYAGDIKSRFEKNTHIKVYNFGLGKEDKRLELYPSKDASSIFKKNGVPSIIEIRKASTFIRSANIRMIDLMKINIEGGEYDLLEELIEEGTVKHIRNIQVQFHDFVPDAYKRMKKIQFLLSATHQLSFQYEFVWENWTLKKQTPSAERKQ